MFNDTNTYLLANQPLNPSHGAKNPINESPKKTVMNVIANNSRESTKNRRKKSFHDSISFSQ
jgi:hypothetical protein